MLRPNDIIGPYELSRKLGSGAFGEVWLAKNIKAITAPPCAIKFAVSDEIDVEAVKREAEVWVLANGHPNVISIIEANVYNDHLVIVSEFARDGSKGKYGFGDDENRLGEYAWFNSNSGGTTHPAGQKRPNDWGLHDMHGNVWEWVQDWYNKDSYRQSVNSIDPQGPSSGMYRRLRGGSCVGLGRYCRSADRGIDRPDGGNGILGLRVVVGARTS